MAVANFRFYEELNDFLPHRRRRCAFACVCARGATVKHAIEALGVPHTEVELILANSESVDFSYLVQEGDRISVYPVFESLDVTPVLKVRAEPLRRTRFIADAQLGGLARYLRMLGFDTLYENGYTDAQVARISADEQRIVLTRDRALSHAQADQPRLLRAGNSAETATGGDRFEARSLSRHQALQSVPTLQPRARAGRERSNPRSAAARKRALLLPLLDLRQLRHDLLGGLSLAPDGAGHR